MKRTTWTARLGAALLVAALLAGCGGKASNSAAGTAELYSAPMASEDSSAMMDAEGGLGSALQPQLDTDRKLIYTAYLRLETLAFDEARQALLAAVEDADGYLESTDIGGSAEDGDRTLDYTVRVPVQNYTSFLDAAGAAGNVLSLSESMQDITNSYIDVQARLDALENQRARLETLAAQAETTADLIEIEAQLSEVQYQIESYTRQMRAMDDQVDYSTVEIHLREVAYLTPVTHTFADRIIEAFFDGWRSFGTFIQDLAVAVVFLLPVLLVAVVILVLVLVCTRKSRAAHKAQRQAMRQARAQAAANAPRAAYGRVPPPAPPVPPAPAAPAQPPQATVPVQPPQAAAPVDKAPDQKP